MPISRNPSVAYSHVLSCDRNLGEKDQTVFDLRHLSIGEYDRLWRRMQAWEGHDEHEREQRRDIEVLRLGLVGWKNLRSPSGGTTEFQARRVFRPGQAGTQEITDASLSVLLPEWRRELSQVILQGPPSPAIGRNTSSGSPPPHFNWNPPSASGQTEFLVGFDPGSSSPLGGGNSDDSLDVPPHAGLHLPTVFPVPPRVELTPPGGEESEPASPEENAGEAIPPESQNPGIAVAKNFPGASGSEPEQFLPPSALVSALYHLWLEEPVAEPPAGPPSKGDHEKPTRSPPVRV